VSENRTSKVGLGFVDILFAIVVGIGFERAIGRPWFRSLPDHWLELDLWMFLLGNTVVIASWVGYHRMMTEEKLDPEVSSVQGLLRFVVDILLLFLYCRLLVIIDAPLDAFRIIAWIFFLYVAWDWIVITERRVEKRSGVSLLWFVVFLGLYFGMSRFRKAQGVSLCYSWCFLGVCSAFAYRLQARFSVPLLDGVTRPATWAFEIVFGRFRRVKQMRIYLAGPYTADSSDERVKNVKRAIDAAIALYEKGHTPYVPHLTHLIDERAREVGIAITREDYVRRWDKPWLEVCDAFLLLGESPGAREELETARTLGKAIFVAGADVVPAVSSRL
jgi:hypothetical protein